MIITTYLKMMMMMMIKVSYFTPLPCVCTLFSNTVHYFSQRILSPLIYYWPHSRINRSSSQYEYDDVLAEKFPKNF